MNSPETRPAPQPPRKRRWWPQTLVILVMCVLMVGVGTGVVVSRLEEDDRFCASCHVVPERTYYNRAQFAKAGVEPVIDLSSAHYLAGPADLPHGMAFRCIDCHRGDEGLNHRVTALALGARDTAIYLVGNPDPAIEKSEIEVPVLLTDSCLKCHTDALLVVGFPNHFHNMLPAASRAWQAGERLVLPEEDAKLYERALEDGLETVDVDLLCVDCHLAHIEKPGSELVGFIDVENVVYPACEQCHVEVFGDPLGLTEAANTE